MLLPVRHATRCRGTSSSRSSSSLLQQQPHTRRALRFNAQTFHSSLSPSLTHTCKVSSSTEAGLQQDQPQQVEDVVQQQAHQAAAMQQHPSCSVIEESEAAAAAAAAMGPANHAQVSGAAAGGTHGPQSSSDAQAGPDAALDTAADAAAATTAAEPADAAATAAADATCSGSDPEQQQQQQEGEEQPKVEFYSFYQAIDEQPVPVQLPPPGCNNELPAQRPVLNKSRYKSPAFLQHFPAPPKHAPFNFLSFLGPVEWQGGKYQVSPAALDDFLLPYFNTAFYSKRRLHIAQSYKGQPYK
jgi:hypothetical protein